MPSALRPRPALTSPLDPSELDRDGFRVVSLLDRDHVRTVRRLLRSFGLDPSHGFFASPAHAPGPAARQFQDAVVARCAEPLARLLPGYEPFMVAVTSKGRRQGQAVLFHHDWTYTDERRVRPLFLWCPLVDAGPHNGGLAVVPGSHRWTTGIRPSRALEATEVHQDAFAERAEALALRAGQAVAFDPALVHGSGPNRTWRRRPAITIALVPHGATLVHFHEEASGRLVGAEVDDRFFTTHPYGSAPEGRAPIDPWDRAVTAEDFAAALAAGPDGGSR